jgi:hypothetical protein
MLPIPMIKSYSIDWSGTYSQPDFLWYDFSAATASTNTTDRNTVSTTGTFSRAWDFSGNSRHSDSNYFARWSNNRRNGLSALTGVAAEICGVGFKSSFTASSNNFTCISYSLGSSNFNQNVVIGTGSVDHVTRYRSVTNETYYTYGSYEGAGSELYYKFPSLVCIVGSTVSLTSNVSSSTQNILNISELYSGTLSGTYSSPFSTPYNIYEELQYYVGVWMYQPTTNATCEFMVWNRHLSQSEMNDVYGYLQTKWGSVAI